MQAIAAKKAQTAPSQLELIMVEMAYIILALERNIELTDLIRRLKQLFIARY